MPEPNSLPVSDARQRILQTAHELFYRDGIRATGIDRVIAEAAVTKVTFYRHFPSKSDLILAFLDYRHAGWMNWLNASLTHQRDLGLCGADAVLATFIDWWNQPQYRGCAFINTAVELGGSEPRVMAIARQHKRDMAQALKPLLGEETAEAADERAQALALALDGAIVRAQMGEPSKEVQAALQLLITPLFAASTSPLRPPQPHSR